MGHSRAAVHEPNPKYQLEVCEAHLGLEQWRCFQESCSAMQNFWDELEWCL